jgi:hypothetical protein
VRGCALTLLAAQGQWEAALELALGVCVRVLEPHTSHGLLRSRTSLVININAQPGRAAAPALQ